MLTGRDPFQSFQREVGRLLDDTFRSFGENVSVLGGKMAVPQIDVHEDDGVLCVTADLPGVREEDVDVTVEGDLLSIRGERQQEAERKQRGYHVVERASGSFQRTVRLPFAPDPGKVTAQYDNGVLTVHLPKRTVSQSSRKIPLGGSAKASSGGAKGENKGPSDEEHVVPGAGTDQQG
jgi:HSP20 family protein